MYHNCDNSCFKMSMTPLKIDQMEKTKVKKLACLVANPGLPHDGSFLYWLSYQRQCVSLNMPAAVFNNSNNNIIDASQ